MAFNTLIAAELAETFIKKTNFKIRHRLFTSACTMCVRFLTVEAAVAVEELEPVPGEVEPAVMVFSTSQAVKMRRSEIAAALKQLCEETEGVDAEISIDLK